MENQKFTKFNVLYIGSDNTIIDQFVNEPDKFEFVSAENGLLAISLLENNHFDVILCENNLPGMKGFEIHKLLNSNNTYKKIIFFLIVHEISNKIREKAIKEKVDDYYLAPLNITNIYDRIRFLLEFKKRTSKSSSKTYVGKEYKMPFIKRAFDIIVSGTILIILSPLLLLVALLIRLESKGKVYYISKRVGTGYKIFDFYKFRSMSTDADKKLLDMKHLNQYQSETIADEDINLDEKCPECERLGKPCSPILHIEGRKICENQYLKIKRKDSKSAFIKIKDDPRITKIGKFIRNLSIDELPQLINVLKGDMSIVGNRPLPLYEAELITSDKWSKRFKAPAGITGKWQVEKRGRGEMSEEERKELDNAYADKNSFLGDITLILKTIPAVFQKENV